MGKHPREADIRPTTNKPIALEKSLPPVNLPPIIQPPIIKAPFKHDAYH
jgi:hypothetical protein